MHARVRGAGLASSGQLGEGLQQGPHRAAGSGALARDLLRDGLLDELHLTMTPVVAGRGRRLFDEPSGLLAFDLVDMRPYPTGAVRLVSRPPGSLRSPPRTSGRAQTPNRRRAWRPDRPTRR